MFPNRVNRLQQCQSAVKPLHLHDTWHIAIQPLCTFCELKKLTHKVTRMGITSRPTL